MEPITIRYGEDVTLPIETGDATDVSATIFIGNPGQLYVLTKTIALTEGAGVFELSPTETAIPLGTYSYQVNVIDSNSKVLKYPSPEGDCDACGNDFPEFIVVEALDSTEVS